MKTVLDFNTEPTQSTVTEIVKMSEEKKLVTIIGKVIKMKKMDKGRCFDVIDRNFDAIQVVLWNQINDEIIEGRTYLF